MNVTLDQEKSTKTWLALPPAAPLTHRLGRAAPLTHRRARLKDVPALSALARRAIETLQAPYLSPRQIAASRAIMGIDERPIADGTYFVAEIGGELAGCGGWSRRASFYGHHRGPGRHDALLDPATDAARVRAMYTDPRFARRGVARLILDLCQEAAAAEGFRRLELIATLAGEPLYLNHGFERVEELTETSGGVPIPLLRMAKCIGLTDGVAQD